MVVAIFRLQEDGTIAESRLAIGCAESFPRLIVEAEYALRGRQPSDEAFTLAAEIASRFIEPLDDENISAGYRRDLVLALTQRALAQARDRVVP